MPAIGVRKRGVRWNDATLAFEMLCEDCARYRTSNGPTFWPLTSEFWLVDHGGRGNNLQRCRACEAEKKRRAERARRVALGPAAIRTRNRAYYVENHAVVRLKDNARKAARRMVTSAA